MKFDDLVFAAMTFFGFGCIGFALASTGFAKAMSNLSANGHVSYPNSDTLSITNSGRDLARVVDRPRSVGDLQRRILEIVGGVKARTLEVLINAYPQSVAKQSLAGNLGYGHVASTGFAKAVSTLSGLGLIEYPKPGFVRARDLLFLEGR